MSGIPGLSATDGLVFALLGIAGLLGVLAVLSPSRFALIAHSGGQWIDTSKLTELLDRRIPVDHMVLRHSRLFGVLVTVSALWLAYVFATRLR